MERYRDPDAISFDHVYFNSARRTLAGARLAAVSTQGQNIADWQAAGDRFPYQRSYLAAPPSVVRAQIGDEFLDQLLQLKPDEQTWQGPIRSQHGYHLVRLLAYAKSEDPQFENVRPAVLDDWQRDPQREALEAAKARIVSNYEVRIAPELRGRNR